MGDEGLKGALSLWPLVTLPRRLRRGDGLSGFSLGVWDGTSGLLITGLYLFQVHGLRFVQKTQDTFHMLDASPLFHLGNSYTTIKNPH